jgi:putative transposase
MSYQGLPDLDYPFHDKAVTVTTCGRICLSRQKVNLSQLFAGQAVGIKQPKIGFGSSASWTMI